MTDNFKLLQFLDQLRVTLVEFAPFDSICECHTTVLYAILAYALYFYTCLC